ncbi:head GIN domain-containing protein [Flavobacterium sp. ST-87]|uniref:Head GIN domain-containing protein n=1 Tax=Flavobacterium plantiphilum TaxID=3163297 RepID=A0ABW8XU77_9FLAO
MLKTKFHPLLLFSFIILLCTSCINYERNETIKTVKSSGNITHETRHLNEDFNKINVSSGINVIIEQSDNTEITVITDEDFQKKIKTKVENGTLYVSNTTNTTTFKFFGYKRTRIHDAATKKVIIKLPVIHKLEANSASKIENKGILRGDHIALKSSAAAEIKLNLEFEKIESESSSAGKIDLKGMALDLLTYTSSAAKTDAEDLLVNNIIAEASSGSKINVYPIVSLKAKASSGSKITYYNKPQQIEKTTNSGSKISFD